MRAKRIAGVDGLSGIPKTGVLDEALAKCRRQLRTLGLAIVRVTVGRRETIHKITQSMRCNNKFVVQIWKENLY